MTAPLPDPLETPRRSSRVWIMAAAAVLSAHIGFAALAITHSADDSDADDSGAPGIEIGLDLASPQAEPTNLPPGPETNAAAEAVAASEQKNEIKPEDLPKETPTTTDEADRQVTTEKVETPVEKPAEKPAPASNASETSVASEATAAPSIQNAPPAEKSVTRQQGTGESRERAALTWQKELMAHLNKFKRYPTDRSQKSVQITVNITLDRTGKVVSATIAKGSGDKAFDDAALSMVEHASPVPAPPPLVADEGLTYLLPVNFGQNVKP